jgi:hypothetical protein
MRSYRTGFLAVIVLCVSAVWADTVELPLTDDAYINANKPDLNTGTWEWIVVHRYGPKYGLVRFDAASIAGQEVSEATLTFYLNSLASNGTISVHAITSGWNEATVTWNNQPPAETTATAIVNLTTAEVESVIAIDVTAAVQRWADGSLADAGFLIITNEGIKAIFDAKEMAGGVPATLTVKTGEPAYTGEAIVLDFTDPANCTIDEPGHYVLDRSWKFYHPYDGCPGFSTPEDPDGYRILISAGDVTLDFRGFEIEDEEFAYGHTIRVSGSNVTLLNSNRIAGADCAEQGGSAIVAFSDASNVRLDNMQNIECVSILGPGGTVVNSAIDKLRMGVRSVVENSYISYSVRVSSDSSIRFNRILGYGASSEIIVNGDGSVIQGNFITEATAGIRIDGAGNVIENNVIIPFSPGDWGIWIVGTANIVDANIVPLYGGIGFDGTGNFFGNNRVALAGGFIGTEGNIDWGGNVSF